MAIAAAAAAGACARDSIAPICPPVVAGDQVNTEIRGAQTGTDDLQWIELYNAGAAQDLEGLHLVLTRLDGAAVSRVIVRRPLEVAAGGYVVIGLGPDDLHAPPVDYGMGTDFAPANLYTAAHVAVSACDTSIDELTYRSLPTGGTRAFGNQPPSAAANDADAGWCTDPSAQGTPGAANPSCP
jgi:hypothetical protein